jgi:hypothetical protein
MPSFLSYRLARSRLQENWHKLSASCTSQANHLTTTHFKGELPFLGSEAFLRGHRHPTEWAFQIEQGHGVRQDFRRERPAISRSSPILNRAVLISDRDRVSQLY